MLPSGLFLCFDCVYLVKCVSLIIGIVAAVLLLFVFASLLLTTFSDPGIIPCSTPREAASNLQCLNVYKRHICGSNQQKSCKVNVQIDGKNFKLRYCFVCNLLQSPRAWHCKKCNKCIERFDHHSQLKRRSRIHPSGRTENPFNKGSCLANFKDVVFTFLDQSSRRVSLHEVFLQYALQRIEEEDEAEELSRSMTSLPLSALSRSQSAPEGLQQVQNPDPLEEDLSKSENSFRSKKSQATSVMVVCS